MKFLRRLYFRRFLRPINRLALTPEVVARTVLVGMAWGMSATAGLQVIGTTATWAVARFVNWRFSLPIALVLTGISNTITLPALYTLYYFTGCRMMACGLGEFHLRSFLSRVIDAPLQTAIDAAPVLGIILLGSLPWTILTAIGGYYFGLWIGRRLEIRRERRASGRAGRRADRRPPAPVPVQRDGG